MEPTHQLYVLRNDTENHINSQSPALNSPTAPSTASPSSPCHSTQPTFEYLATPETTAFPHPAGYIQRSRVSNGQAPCRPQRTEEPRDIWYLSSRKACSGGSTLLHVGLTVSRKQNSGCGRQEGNGQIVNRLRRGEIVFHLHDIPV